MVISGNRSHARPYFLPLFPLDLFPRLPPVIFLFAMATTNATSNLTKGPSRQSCLGCRRRKAKCDRTRPTCELCARMGEKCEYDVRPAVPKTTELAALEDRIQFVERLLSAQALLLAPLLSSLKYGKVPSFALPTSTSSPAGNDGGSEWSSDQSATPQVIRAIKRTASLNPNAGDSTPAALSAFYLDLGKRMQENSSPVASFGAGSTQTFVPLTGNIPPSQISTVVANERTFLPSGPQLRDLHFPEFVTPSSLKRSFQVADLLPARSRTPAISPPAWGNLLAGDVGQRPLTGDEPWAGELVGRDLMDHLVNFYFLTIHPFLPIVHRPSFLALIQEPQTRQPLQPVLHAMVAITLGRASSLGDALPTKLKSQESRDRLVAQARKKAILLALDRLTLEALQCLTILAFDGLGSRAQPRAWSIIGMLTRMAIQCQVNRECTPTNTHSNMASTPSDISSSAQSASENLTPISVLPMSLISPPKDWVEAETRRRVFWTIVFLDRFGSAGTGFHVALNRRDLLCKLPAPELAYETSTEVPSRYMSPLSPFRFRPHPAVLEENDDAMDAPLSIFACLIEASEALGSVHHFMLEAGKWGWRQRLIACQELDMKLTAWRLNLPKEVQTLTLDANGRPNPLVVLVHAVYNASIIILHQNFAYPGPLLRPTTTEQSGPAMPMNPSKSCLSRCVATTKEMTALIRFALPHMASQSTLLAFSLFVSARAILVHIKHRELMAGETRGPLVAQEEEEFRLHIEALKALSVQWSLAARFVNALENARADRSNSATRPSSSHSREGRASSINAGLLDLRLSAFNQGVSPSTFGEHSGSRKIKNLPRQDSSSWNKHASTSFSDNGPENNRPPPVDVNRAWTTSETPALGQSAYPQAQNRFVEFQGPHSAHSRSTSFSMEQGGMPNVRPPNGGSKYSFPLPGLRSRSASFNGYAQGNFNPTLEFGGAKVAEGGSEGDGQNGADTNPSELTFHTLPTLSGLGDEAQPTFFSPDELPGHRHTHSQPAFGNGDPATHAPARLNQSSPSAPAPYSNDMALDSFNPIPTGDGSHIGVPEDNNAYNGLFGLDFYGLPGEEYGGPVIDWTIFERLLSE